MTPCCVHMVWWRLIWLCITVREGCCCCCCCCYRLMNTWCLFLCVRGFKEFINFFRIVSTDLCLYFSSGLEKEEDVYSHYGAAGYGNYLKILLHQTEVQSICSISTSHFISYSRLLLLKVFLCLNSSLQPQRISGVQHSHLRCLTGLKLEENIWFEMIFFKFSDVFDPQ